MEGFTKFISVTFGAVIAIWGLINIPAAALSERMGSFVFYTAMLFLGIWILGKTLK